MDHTFQVDLPVLIDLLGRRLHDHPSYFIRDLIQLAADSIRAREAVEPDHAGAITIEVLGGKTPTLAFLDNGLGLTEAEAHEHLGTIGRSGLGLLSSFAVAEEIAVISMSSRPEPHPVVEWRGKPDGTYMVRTIDRKITAGTQVYVTCKPGWEDLFSFDVLCDLTRDFASCLPYPIRVVWGEESSVINWSTPPWRRRFTSTEQQTRELLEFGREAYDDLDFFDAIPLRSKVGEVEGVAYVIPYPPSLEDMRAHIVYHGDILLTQAADWLLPEWADFVLCVINIDGLEPTSPREAILEEDDLDSVRDSVEQSLREYLVGVATRDPAKLSWLLLIHARSIKALALRDDEFYRLLIDWLVFETSIGEMTLGEARERFGSILYITSEEQFREIAPIASARGIGILFAATAIDAELLSRLAVLVEGADCEILDPDDWGPTPEDHHPKESIELRAFLTLTENILRPHQCSVDLAAFLPTDPPALYSPPPFDDLFELDPEHDAEQDAEHDVEQESDELPDFAVEGRMVPLASLALNTCHPLILGLAKTQDRAFQARAVEILYLQALLAGRYPLGPREMAIVTSGLTELLRGRL